MAMPKSKRVMTRSKHPPWLWVASLTYCTKSMRGAMLEPLRKCLLMIVLCILKSPGERFDNNMLQETPEPLLTR